ncbi:hypothetical protein [Laspinema olomoucense]|uniref:hypothetical protein n=1 Tax=Laspinema olomoucense TaxID=3231600 RepID=UPI0021BB592C|nr:hypothetical protein [Laspinema sp. D3a]MCT7990107.1 hypothetical protein [Laspinema sp. D3a]
MRPGDLREYDSDRPDPAIAQDGDSPSFNPQFLGPAIALFLQPKLRHFPENPIVALPFFPLIPFP